MQADLTTEVLDHDAPALRRDEDFAQPESTVQRLVYSCPVDHTGMAVYVKGWFRPETKSTPLLFIHDVGEHFGLYSESSAAICARGHNVYGFDLRGHGRSGRRAGHIPKFGVLVKDLLQVSAWVRNREDGRAPVLIGQGVGALIALSFHKHFAKHCSGIVLASPSISLTKQPNRFQSWAVKVLAESSPTFRLPNFLRPRITEVMSLDQQVISTPDEPVIDITNKITARYAHEILQAIENSSGLLESFKGESLILCPEDDALCRYDSILQIVAGFQQRDAIRVEMIADAGHQLFSGKYPGREAAIDLLLSWLGRHDKDKETK